MDSPGLTVPTQAPGKRRSSPRQAGDHEETASKPKKVNSEIRKQQNRIASRNYREKRKRRLQYLQRLVKDDAEDGQETEASAEHQGVHARSLSADHDVDFAGSSPSPYHMPSNSDFGSTSLRSGRAPKNEPTTSTASFSSHHAAASRAFAAYPQSWIAPVYSSASPVSQNGHGSIAPAWMSGVEHSNHVPLHYSFYHQTSKAPVPVEYSQTGTPLHQLDAYSTHPNTDMYAYCSSYASQQRVRNNPTMSLPTSSQGYQAYYHGPH